MARFWTVPWGRGTVFVPLCFALLASCAWGDHGQSHYVESVLKPRVLTTLRAFLDTSTQYCELTHRAMAMGVIDDTSEALMPWLFAQIENLEGQTAANNVDLVYVGLEDGRFLAYDNTSMGRWRLAGDSTMCEWNSTMRHTETCRWTDGPYISCTPVPNTTIIPPTGLGVVLYYSTSVSRQGKLDNVRKIDDSYDPRVRVWYKNEMARYDNRIAIKRSTGSALYACAGNPCADEDQTCETLSDDACKGNEICTLTSTVENISTWSPIYAFSMKEKGLGLTRTAAMPGSRAPNNRPPGVIAVDITLRALSLLLKNALRDSGDNTWAYIVDLDADNDFYECLVASSDDVDLNANGTLDTCIKAEKINQTYIRASLQALNNSGHWEHKPKIFESDGSWFEAVATLTCLDTNICSDNVFLGLKWLLVLVQDITCGPNEMWEPSAGTCKACDPTHALLERECKICNEEFPGSQPNDEQTACTCPAGYYAALDNSSVNCAQCRPDLMKLNGSFYFDTELARASPVSGDGASLLQWPGDAEVCPGEDIIPGENTRTQICPLEGVWINIRSPADQATGVTRVDLYGCSFCTNAINSSCNVRTNHSDNITTHYSANCKPHHKGYFCLECEEHWEWDSASGECVECKDMNWSMTIWWLLLAIATGLVHLKKIFHISCPPDIALAVFDAISADEGAQASSSSSVFLEMANVSNVGQGEKLNGERSVNELMVRLGNPLGWMSSLGYYGYRSGKPFFGWQLDKLQAKVAEIHGKKKETWWDKAWANTCKRCWANARDEQPTRRFGRATFPKSRPEDESVSCDRAHFEAWMEEQQTKDHLATFMFFYQTLVLVMKTEKVSFTDVFGPHIAIALTPLASAASVFFDGEDSLDIVGASQEEGEDHRTCMFSGCGLFCDLTFKIVQLVVVPLLTMLLGAYVLNRRQGIPVQAKHLYTAALQAFSYSFLPVTARAFGTLACRSIPDRANDTAEDWLLRDMTTKCWTDHHIGAAVLASLILLLYIGALAVLVVNVYRISTRRTIPTDEREPQFPLFMVVFPGIYFMALSFVLGFDIDYLVYISLPIALVSFVLGWIVRSDLTNRSNWLLRSDTYASGQLRSTYSPRLLGSDEEAFRPCGADRPAAIAAEQGTLVTILTEGNREWCLCRLENGNEGYIPRTQIAKAPITDVSPILYLCKGIRPCKYWWFAFLLCVKLTISLIILAGERDNEFKWKQWMIILLSVVALISHYHSPYVRKSDDRMEQIMLTSLVCITVIVQASDQFGGVFNSADVTVSILIIVGLAYSVRCFTARDIIKNAKSRQARLDEVVARREKLRQRTLQQLFTKAMPQILLLEKDARHEITRHFIREEFDADTVIYERGSEADLFYIVLHGQVKLFDESSGKQILLPNSDGVNFFGAGALAKQDVRRPVQASSATSMSCLRIHRDDFRRTWASWVENLDAVHALFDNIDRDVSGRVERAELEEHLIQHAREDHIDTRSAVDTLMWILDEDEDGRISEEECQRNLKMIPPDDDELLQGVLWAVRARTASEVAVGMRTGGDGGRQYTLAHNGSPLTIRTKSQGDADVVARKAAMLRRERKMGSVGEHATVQMDAIDEDDPESDVESVDTISEDVPLTSPRPMNDTEAELEPGPALKSHSALLREELEILHELAEVDKDYEQEYLHQKEAGEAGPPEPNTLSAGIGTEARAGAGDVEPASSP